MMNIIEPLDQELYDEYIKRILESRENIKDENEYQEHHHILPRCLNGEDSKENLIWLYAQEHYYAHKMLALENPECDKLQYAWWNMNQCTQNGMRMFEIEANDYYNARKNFSNIMKNNSYAKNNVLSKETRQKMSEARKGKNMGKENHMYGKHCSDKTKELIRIKTSGKNNHQAKKVLCIETKQIFDTIKEATKWCNIGHSDIAAQIGGRQKTAGKHPETGEKLHWTYVE